MTMTATKAEETTKSAGTAFDIKSLEGKYLTFLLCEEDYGLAILQVREIIGMQAITVVPQMPHYVKGVINLRGKVIPVIDLRLKFDLPEREYDDQTCTIVTDVGGTLFGIIVDTVSEVLDITEEQLEPPPAICAHVDSKLILGLGKVKDRVKILLDVDHLLASGDLSAFSGEEDFSIED